MSPGNRKIEVAPFAARSLEAWSTETLSLICIFSFITPIPISFASSIALSSIVSKNFLSGSVDFLTSVNTSFSIHSTNPTVISSEKLFLRRDLASLKFLKGTITIFILSFY